jgi:hypothetical protein
MRNDSTNSLSEALAGITSRERRAIQGSAADARDRRRVRGEHNMATVWQAVVLLAAEADDRQRDILAALDDPPNVAGIVPEEGDTDQ